MVCLRKMQCCLSLKRYCISAMIDCIDCNVIDLDAIHLRNRFNIKLFGSVS